ncbi:hypothetical protein LCGC14_0782390 [marine sediment metagenome]|uniref:Helix-turn-helix domain-containing protein n=1 Tax=marine sediment metagenome TaxID=412755 RepID=A0A0F9T259_9ZZZZ
MSIEIMTRVWKQSKQGGSQLLLLLAIADNANDGGFAWPGQEYLADKIRMSAKSIPRLTKKLQEAGELFIHNRAEQGKVTQYIITVGMDWSQLEETLRRYLKFDKAQLAFTKRGYTKKSGVDIAMRGGVDIAMSTEPSLTVNEPSFLENPQVNGKDGFDRADQAERGFLNALAGQVATITKTDIDTAGPSTRESLKQLTLALSKKPNIEVKLPAYERWWYANDWRGKQGQPPTAFHIGDTWGQFEADKVAPPPSSGPTLTDAEKARLTELTAQFSQPK